MRRATLLFLLILSACLCAAPAMAAAPTATTSAESSANTHSTAHLVGFVVRNGEDTTYHFEYGTDTTYGARTADVVLTASSPIGGCAGCNPVSTDIAGLTGSTTYHFRIVASNASGPGASEDRTVTTPASPPPSPPPDRDADGFADASDACPDQYAPGTSNGCQPPPPADSDGDGTPDSMDACPSISGPPAGSNNANGCPPQPTGLNSDGSKMPTADDLDADGVPNAADKCAKSYQNEKVDSQGCGPFSCFSVFGARSTLEIQDDPGVGVQCRNHAGKACKARLTLTLSAASAKRLGLARKLFDVSISATKSAMGGSIAYNGRDIVFSRKIEKAFKRAYAERIPVTMTFTGTFTHGTKAYTYPKSTFTMKRKPPGGSAYRVEPYIENGDNGPKFNGLTRKADPDDF
jgi:hypothetical protein